MPFTPYHFGPCALAALPFGRRIDLPVFLLANVAVDIEPLTILALGLPLRPHGFFHSFLIGSLVAALWAAAAWPLRGLFARAMAFLKLDYAPTFPRMLGSALASVWFHVALDATLYADQRPLYPGAGNPFLGLLASETAYGFCALSFIPAIALYFFLRSRRARKTAAAAVILFLAAVSAAPAAPAGRGGAVREATGQEWLELSGLERQDEVLKAMAILFKSGVEPSRQPHEYYSKIHEKLRRDPSLYDAQVSQILAVCVYEDEPQARAKLDALRKRKEAAR